MRRNSEHPEWQEDLESGFQETTVETLVTVTKQMGAAVTRCSRDFKYVWANQAYANWIQRPLNEIVGRPIWEVLGKDAFESLLPHANRVFTGETVRYEQEMNFRSIGPRWISATYTPTVDPQGWINAWVAVVLDITERKLAEEAAKESEQRFRLVADTAPVLIWMSGTDKLCTYFNKPWLNFTGRSIEQELGNGWAEGVHGEDLQRCVDTYTQAFDRREEFQMEYRLRRHDGEYRWILDIGVPRFNQDRSFAGYIGSCVDVTQRKLADDVRIRHSAIVESSDDAIVGLDVTGTVVNWNKGAERLYGYSAKEAIGRNISFLSTADDPDDIPKTFKKVIGGEVLRHYETVRLRKDGTKVEVSLTLSPIVDAEDRIVGMSGIARDITERKRAEAAVKASEKKFSKVFRQNPTPLTLTRVKDHRYLDVNEAFERATGWHRDEVIGQTAYDICLWVDPSEGATVVSRLLTGGVLRDQEVRYRRKDSAERVALASADLIEIESEPCILSTIADITERKLADEARFRHAAIVESSEDAITSVTLDGVIASWNAGAQRLFGYTEEEAIGKSVAIAIPPELAGQERKIIETLMAGGHIEYFETERITKAGERIAVSLSVSPIKDSIGAIVGFCGIARDISDRKRQEEALRESEQRFRLAAQAGKMYSFEWDFTTDRVVRSPEHVQVLGLTEPLSFQQQQFVDRIHPDDHPRLRAAFAGLTPENPTAEFTYRGTASDGTLLWLKTNGRGFFDGEGKLLPMIGMVTDVTDQKRAEEALSGMSRKLIEGQEQERARIARELHDDITQRLAMLAIEIEQVEEFRSGMPSEVRDWAHKLSGRARDIVSDIQSLSHELHSSALEHLGLEKGVKSWCKEFGERQKLEIDFQSHHVPELPKEISLCLFRVLQEALQNAAKHSGTKRIDVQLAGNSDEIHLIVIDSGAGFDVKALGRRRGLGLTSMQERVRLVGGSIVIESKPKVGTTIQVRVPIGAQRDRQHQVAAG